MSGTLWADEIIWFDLQEKSFYLLSMYIEDDMSTFGWCRSLTIRCFCGGQVCVCVELLAHLGDLLFGDGHEPTDQFVTFF
jgi:hypothetical protein